MITAVGGHAVWVVRRLARLLAADSQFERFFELTERGPMATLCTLPVVSCCASPDALSEWVSCEQLMGFG